MNPVGSDLFVSRPLTTVANNYMAVTTGFVADRVFPILNVTEKAGTYYEINRGDWFRVEARERAPSTESVGTGFRVTQRDIYDARIYAVHSDIDDQTRATAQNLFNLERSHTQLVSQDLLLLREQKWANNFFTTGVWGTDITGVGAGPTGNQLLQWDQTNSTPIKDIRTWKRTMQKTQGYAPNVLVIGPLVLDVLLEHPTVIDRIKYTERGIVSLDLLATLFDVDRIVVPEAIINSGAEGAADSFDFIYGKNMLLAYANPNPDIEQPSAGYIFAWTGYLGATAFGSRIKRFRMEGIASDRIEGEMAFDMKVVTSALGMFFSGVIA